MDIGLKILISSVVTLLILSFLIFLIYKVLQVRTRRDVRKAYYNAMSRMWFGLFMVIFGINSMIQFNTVVSYIIGGIFILFGGFNAWHFNKARKYFKDNLPIENKAWEELERKQHREKAQR
ncbi:YtpI family protein [Phocicoccus pinnipedialis]|uniref:YtpI-like protein n=1 Tax=Phocicoccus pinnipedialis TaxID=110845 RepID=A0A6V7RBR9_9BACL|nr:YtpI family protein [Jeotgalicoccus pinnipedialis]MBP1939503.1 threonine/homoserine/homoserine lactone efflux protein [Jeotgalicoccus pinnipedialis]CAD2075114.1 hypothetical protein JEOPIN946_00936 [Jeotgalicoccus pinnipedialis]